MVLTTHGVIFLEFAELFAIIYLGYKLWTYKVENDRLERELSRVKKMYGDT